MATHAARKGEPSERRSESARSRVEQPSGRDATPRVVVSEPLCAVFRRRLRDAGQKYTPERAAVLDAIIRIDDVFEADHLRETLKGAGYRVSKATIYRTLRVLQETGIIQPVLVDAEQTRWQLAYGRRPRDLIIRLDTGEIIPVDIPELLDLRDRLCAQRRLKPEGHRLHIFAVANEPSDETIA